MNRRTTLATAASALATAGILVGILPTAAAAAPAAMDCIQNPTANSQNTAHFTGTNVNIHTGPFTACTPIGEGEPGDSVTARCAKLNSNNVLWVYLNDHTRGKIGWSEAKFVTWSGLLINC